MKKTIDGSNKVYFGTNKETKERIYISKPTFACEWYWSFGYLGNKDCHYHLNSYQSKDHFFTLKDGSHKLITEKRNINMYDAILADYEDLNENINKSLWDFVELAQTIYTLKEAFEVFHRGGSRYTKNPCQSILKSKEKADDINFTVLPALLQAFWNLVEGN